MFTLFCEQVTDKKFDNKVEWGIDLASKHERCSNFSAILLNWKCVVGPKTMDKLEDGDQIF